MKTKSHIEEIIKLKENLNKVLEFKNKGTGKVEFYDTSKERYELRALPEIEMTSKFFKKKGEKRK